MLDNIKNFLKNKNLLILSGIILGTFLLRMWGLDKPDGFWNDEIYTYNQAAKDFPFGIIYYSTIIDRHMPLYQLLLHLWMKIFGNGDYVLRTFSVILGTISVFFGYLAGRELKDKKTGLVAASLMAVNSVFVYYSQEVRFYVLCILFSTMACYFLAKLNKEFSTKNLVGLIFANLGIIYSYTIGFAFVIAEILCFSFYFFLKNKEDFSNFLRSQLILLLLAVPSLVAFSVSFVEYNKKAGFLMDLPPFFNEASLLIIIQNWFTPVISDLGFHELKFIDEFFLEPITIVKVFFILLPIFIYFFLIQKSFRQNNINKAFFFTSILFMVFELIAVFLFDFKMITRFTLLAIPPLLLIAAYALTSLKEEFFKKSLIFLVGINLFYFVFFPLSSPKLERSLGRRLAANMLLKYDFNSQDSFLFQTNADTLDKYYYVKVKKISLMELLENKETLKYFIGEENIEKLNRKNRADIFNYYLTSPYINPFFESYLKKVINETPKGRFVVLVCRNPFVTEMVKNNPSLYRSFVSDLAQERLYFDSLKILGDNMQPAAAEKQKGWEIYIFQKK